MKKRNKVLCGGAQVIPSTWVKFLEALDVLGNNPDDIMCCGQFTRCPMSEAMREVHAQEDVYEPDYSVSLER